MAASRRFISIILILDLRLRQHFKFIHTINLLKIFIKQKMIWESSVLFLLSLCYYSSKKLVIWLTEMTSFSMLIDLHSSNHFTSTFLYRVCKTNKRKCLLQNLFCQRSMARYLSLSFHRIDIHHRMILRYISYIHAFYDVTYYWDCIDPIDDLATNDIIY